MAAPFMYQTPCCPVARLPMTRSGCASPLKSPTPAICQLGSPVVPGVNRVALVMAAPFMYQTPMSPVARLPITMSG